VSTLLRWLFGCVGIGFLAVAFNQTWQRSQGLPIPSAWAFGAAGLLIIGGLMCLARAWTRLFSEAEISRALSAAFYTSQLGRYIPGVIWQVLAQVGLATQAGASLPQASTAFGVFALVELAAGGVIGATLGVSGGDLAGVARLSAGLMLVPLLLLQRRWIVWAIHLAARLTRRSFADDLVPGQSAIVRSFFWTVATLVLNCVAFAILLHSMQVGAPIVRTASAFGFAWTVGFVAIPFPSGIGIREAVLMLTVASQVPKSSIIAASVGHRLVGMVSELVMIVVSRVGLKPAARPATEVAELDHPSGSA
jgi:uncharacterized membrane protein YbhN (UPF0104 family)